jgi:hypothetical protein
MRGLSGLVGLAAVLGALISLYIPLSLGVVDRTGTPITCGTGLYPDSSTARHEDSLNHQEHHLVSTHYLVSDYAGECGELIAARRWMAGGVGALGAVLVVFGASAIIGPVRRPVSGYAAQ